MLLSYIHLNIFSSQPRIYILYQMLYFYCKIAPLKPQIFFNSWDLPNTFQLISFSSILPFSSFNPYSSGTETESLCLVIRAVWQGCIYSQASFKIHILICLKLIMDSSRNWKLERSFSRVRIKMTTSIGSWKLYFLC